MPTQWQHRVFVIGTSASIGAAIGALDVAFPRDDGQPRDLAHPGNYGVPLSASGQAPATHYGAIFSVTEPLRVQLEGMGLANVPGISYWRATNPEGVLATTNHAGSVAQIGQVWDWKDSMAKMGLQPANAQ
jgi:hypothetical protein